MVPDEATGIAQLDRVLGPIPEHSALLFANDPGIEGEVFLYHLAQRYLLANNRVLYAVFNRGPSTVRRSMREFGFDGDSQNLLFIDGFSPLMGASEDAPFEIRRPADVAEFVRVLEQATAKHPDATLLVDPLSALVDHAGMDAFTSAVPALVAALQKARVGAALFTQWPYGDVSRVFDEFDAQVSLHAVEGRLVLSQYFSVERARWRTLNGARPVLYKTYKPGGVLAYIPKILVTGPYHAGKSTFIHSVSETAVSVNRLGTTVALDHGHALLDGLAADIFGTPGQTRFEPLIRQLAHQAVGVVLVVDATQPETFPRAREMIDQTWKVGLPLVIAASKQDLPGALPPEEVRRGVGAPRGLSFATMPCVSTDSASCRAVLHALVDQILSGGSRLAVEPPVVRP